MFVCEECVCLCVRNVCVCEECACCVSNGCVLYMSNVCVG